MRLPENKALISDVIKWDVVNWKKCLDIWQSSLESNMPLNCLEIGAKFGGLSLWAALHGHNVTCSDYHNPKETAKPLHSKYGVDSLINYQSIDVLRLDQEKTFDVVFLKSILPSITREGQEHNREVALQNIHDSLKTSGKLLFAENVKGSWVHQLGRRFFVRWGSSVNYMTRKEFTSSLSQFDQLNLRTVGFLGAFGRTEPQRVFLGRIDQFLDPILPTSWKYLAIGTATKSPKKGQ